MSSDGNNYYDLTQNNDGSIYDIWERGGNYNDSITPSTWCKAYKRMMVETIERRISRNEGTRVLSLGCGNAAVEGELVRRGVHVTGLDVNAEAVRYAREKGVDAIEGDFFSYEPEQPFDIVYADGVFGHFYGDLHEVASVHSRITRMMLARDGVVIVSNDAPRGSSEDVQEHPHVPGFHFLAASYLAAQAVEADMQVLEQNIFVYSRPLSGECPRAIVISKPV